MELSAFKFREGLLKMPLLNAKAENQTGQNLFTIVISTIMVANIIDLYLSSRQLKVLNSTLDVPNELKDHIDAETFNNARVYSTECEDLRMCRAVFRIFVAYFELHFEMVSNVWNYLGAAVKSRLDCPANDDRCSQQELAITCLFTIAMVIYNFLKISICKTFEVFVMESHYRHNRQTVGYFIKEQLLSLLTAIIKAVPIAMGIIVINQKFESNYLLFMWTFVALMLTLWMSLITPVAASLCQKYTPIKEGPLYDNIASLAKSPRFPLANVDIVLSKNPLMHNKAHVCGLGPRKRLVLSDMLFKNKPNSNKIEPISYTDKEILAIVAHQIGHFHNKHLLCNYLLMQANLLILCHIYCYWYDDPSLYSSFGFESNRFPIIVAIYILYFYILEPYHMLFNVFQLFIFRRYEYEADKYACTLVPVEDMQNLVLKMSQENLEFPISDWLYSVHVQTTPNVLDRLEALKKLKTI